MCLCVSSCCPNKYIPYWWKSVIKKVCSERWTKVFMSVISFSKKKKILCQILTLGSWTRCWNIIYFKWSSRSRSCLQSTQETRSFLVTGILFLDSPFGAKPTNFMFFLNGVSLAQSAWICGFYGFLNLKVNREKAHSSLISGLLFWARFAFDGEESVSVNSPCPLHSELYVSTGFQ